MSKAKPLPLARASTIRRAIARTERYLLSDLDSKDRAAELDRLATLKALVRQAR